MRLRGLLVCLVTLAAVGVSSPALAAKKRIAVPDMHMAGGDGMGRTLTEILTTETARVDSLTVISSSDIAAMLGFEKQKELLGCADNVACMAEIGGALGVDYLLVADVGLVGKTYVLNAKLIDTNRIQVMTRIYRTVAGEPDALIEAVRACVPEILKPIASAAELAVLAPATPPPARPVAVTPVAPPPAATAQALDSGPTRWPGWTLTTLGGVGLLLTGVLEFAAKHDYDRAQETRVVAGVDLHSSDAATFYSSAESTSKVARITGAVGGVMAVGGITWLLLTRRPAPVTITLRADHEQTGAAVLARF